MKFTSKVLLTAACLTMMLSSCSDEPQGGPEEKGDSAYATLTLSLPVGSRSQTNPYPEDPDNPNQDSWDKDHNTNSNAGYEIGNADENNVGSVLIILAGKSADGTYTYLDHDLADPSQAGTAAKPVYTIQLNPQKLKTYAGKNVVVFAFCNPTTEAINAANSGFANAKGTISDADNADIWTPKGFLMSNHCIRPDADLPTLPTLEELQNTYNVPTNPFNLGTVEVERVAARFDFKATTYSGETTANRYPIIESIKTEGDDGETTTKTTKGYVTLTDMAVYNVAKSYYLLPRVTTNENWDGTNPSPTLCGLETNSNWIVSPGYSDKIASPIALTYIKNQYFHNGQPESATSSALPIDFRTFSYQTITSVLNGTASDPDNWHDAPSGYNKTGYHIWRYVTENTIPGVDNQRHAITTGVVFKGNLQATNTTDAIGGAMAAGNVIYAYGNTIYGNLASLKTAVLNNPVSSLADAFKESFGIDEINETTLAGVTEDLSNSLGKGKHKFFTIYRPSGTTGNYTYPVYYVYYNRHNDNLNNTMMGPMEFATVRNNIYKLAVTGINRLGHPGNPDDDPDPEKPDDPDESEEAYFQVSVRVLPWVVRVNNIIL